MSITVSSPESCRACGNLIASCEKKLINGFLKGTTFEYVTCPKCGTMQTGVGDLDGLTNIYNAIYNHSRIISGYKRYYLYGIFSGNRFLRKMFDIFYAERLYHGAYTFIKKQSEQEQRKLKILEVGAGLGYTTARLRKLGHDVIGCDLSKDACTIASKLHGGEFICGTIDYVNEKHGRSFDVVVCLEVIEHIEDPLQFLTNLKSILCKNGTIILSTPNLFIPNIWNTTEPPIHVTYFTKKGINELIERANGIGQLIAYSQLHNNKIRTIPTENLPGSVLLEDFTPNSNYFDNGRLSLAQALIILFKNQFNKFFFSCLRKSYALPIRDHVNDLQSTSIIVSIGFPRA